MSSAPSPAGEAPVPLLLPLLRNGVAPTPDLDAVRTSRPVARLDVPTEAPPVWLVTGREEVRAVLGDAEQFSNDLSHLTGTGLEALAAQDPGGLGFTDPPEHTRLRRLLAGEFTVRRLQELAPRIEQVVADRLDAMQRLGPPVDLVAEFAVPVPSLVICALFGVPERDRTEFEQRSTERFDVLGSMADSLTAVNASMAYLTELVSRQRAEPGSGMLGNLLREHGDEVSDVELAGLADGVLTGGHETTASMLALGALVLLEDPGLATDVRSGDVPVTSLVEELLRHLSVVQVAFPRFARTAMVLGNQKIDIGDVLLCSLSGANRDTAFGVDPERVDPRRRPATHLAFGHGVHRCLGAELGRMELRTALPALLRRFPGLRLAGTPAELEFRTISLVHGVRSLPVAW